MNKTIIFFGILFSFMAFAGEKEGGNSGDLVGNGGDGQVIEFRNIGLDLAEKLRNLNATCQTQIPFSALEFVKIVYRAHIESSEKELYLQGRRVEAINYLSLKKIIFHSPSFDRNKNKPQFIMHEFLGLLGVTDKRGEEEYGVSKFLLSLVNQKECQSLVSKRKWIKKKILNDVVYFQFEFPKEIIPYDLKQGTQLSSIDIPKQASKFDFWKGEIYYSFARQVCNSLKICIDKSLVPWILHDFAFVGDRLVESIIGIRDANDFFIRGYDFENIQVVDLENNDEYSFKLKATQHEQSNSSSEYIYTSLRQMLSISNDTAVGIVDRYGKQKLNSFSLARFEWRNIDQEYSKPIEIEKQYNDYLVQDIYKNKTKLNVTQRISRPSILSIPQEIYLAQGGSYIVTDDGNVYESSRGLNTVALIEAPVEDLAQYGSYTLVLSLGRVLIYDENWHLQGEFTPSVIPQGIAIKDQKIILFSMLSDQKIYTQEYDINNFFKKRRQCLVTKKDLENIKFIDSYKFKMKDSTYYVEPSLGCILRFDNDQWKPWMGYEKSLSLDFFQEKGIILGVDHKANIYLLDIVNRDETLIAVLNMNVRNGKRINNGIELVLHHSGLAPNIVRIVGISTQGRILYDYLMWTMAGDPYRDGI